MDIPPCGDYFPPVFNRYRNIPLTPVKALIGLNILAFVFIEILPQRQHAVADHLLGLSGAGLAQGMVWQFVTYQFLHAGILHLAVNMMGLWFTGNILERVLGARNFIVLYLLCGITGGIAQLAINPFPTLIGASGAVSGLVAAFSTLYPRMPITALLFFVIPVRMQAMWLGILVVGLSLFFLLTGLFGDIGNAAHIGGALAGFLWVKYRQRHFRIVR
ncbi:MAG: rhomboid family intramembrane serine protease [bacterium]